MLVLKYFDSIFWGLSSAFRNHLVEEKSPWFNAGPFVLSTRILRKILLCILALSLPFHCSSAKVLIKSLMSVYFFSNEISTFQIFKVHSLIFYLNRCEVWQVFCGTEGFLSPRLRERVHPCPPALLRRVADVRRSHVPALLHRSASRASPCGSQKHRGPYIFCKGVCPPLPSLILGVSQNWPVPSWKRQPSVESSLRKGSFLLKILVHLVFIASTIFWCL